MQLKAKLPSGEPGMIAVGYLLQGAQGVQSSKMDAALMLVLSLPRGYHLRGLQCDDKAEPSRFFAAGPDDAKLTF